MKINSVGTTKIIKKADFMCQPYKDLADYGCTHIRQRLLKDGSTVLMGYEKGQKVSKLTQHLPSNPYVHMLAQRFYNVEAYGPKKELKEVSIEKCWYNQIGDLLKFKHVIRNYKENNLLKRFEVKTDILKGEDLSITTYAPASTEYQEKNIGKICKQRISPCEYLESLVDAKGNFVFQDRKVINDKDGFWKYD